LSSSAPEPAAAKSIKTAPAAEAITTESAAATAKTIKAAALKILETLALLSAPGPVLGLAVQILPLRTKI
jgi:hypothetical protein